MNKDDGGSAFPNAPIYGLQEEDGIYELLVDEQSSGMTLRDYFAAKAMQKLMGKMHDSIFKTLKKSYKTEDAIEMSKGMIVDTAYQWADAMLKAREEA